MKYSVNDHESVYHGQTGSLVKKVGAFVILAFSDGETRGFLDGITAQPHMTAAMLAQRFGAEVS